MIVRTACAAGFVLAAGACTSGVSGGAGSPAGRTQPAPATTAPAAPSTSSSHSARPRSATGTPPRASRTTPRPSTSAYTPPPPVGCAQLPASLGRLRRGGAMPSGVPVPQAVPSVVCTGTAGAMAAVWRNVDTAQYVQELTGTGWTASGRTYRKPHAPRTITVLSVRGALVAVYRPS